MLALFCVLEIPNIQTWSRNSNWVWHCTLPYNWLPVPHRPTLHHFIVSWSYDETNDVQYPQPTPIWPGSSIHWATVINTCIFWKVMGSIPNLVRAYLCPYHFGCSAKVWIECCQWDFAICPVHGNGSRFSLYMENKWWYIYGNNNYSTVLKNA